MQDENGNEIQVGDSVEMTCVIEEEMTPGIGQDTVLPPGVYQIEVPEGQKATVRYSLSLT